MSKLYIGTIKSTDNCVNNFLIAEDSVTELINNNFKRHFLKDSININHVFDLEPEPSEPKYFVYIGKYFGLTDKLDQEDVHFSVLAKSKQDVASLIKTDDFKLFKKIPIIHFRYTIKDNKRIKVVRKYTESVLQLDRMSDTETIDMVI